MNLCHWDQWWWCLRLESRTRRSLSNIVELHSLTSVTLSCLAEWIRVLLPMTGVGLRWKSLTRQESVEAGEKDLICFAPLSLSLWNQTVFVFPRSFSSLYSRSQLTFPSYFFKQWEALMQHHPCQHPHPHHRHRYPHCHRLFGYTHSSFKFNWQLEAASEGVYFSPVRQPPPSLLSPCNFSELCHCGLMWVICQWRLLSKRAVQNKWFS